MGIGEKLYSIKWLFLSLAEKLAAMLKPLFAHRIVRLVFVIVPALAVIILIISITAARTITRSEAKKAASPQAWQISNIPEAEVFLPDEPDFLPDVLFERQQKKEWTAEDAQIFWNDPSDYPSEMWRERLSKQIDRLLESVP
ncbi:hypothetical protein AGMMS50212_03740 [Spirochaetia bacterium]|nr:hypothetical protein AGMMS50212_03740 [Spirochaetia bacterium]